MLYLVRRIQASHIMNEVVRRQKSVVRRILNAGFPGTRHQAPETYCGKLALNAL